MSGVNDCHYHLMFHAPLPVLLNSRDGYLTLIAAREAEALQMRGFTTIRDIGSNPFSLKAAIHTRTSRS